MSRPLTEFKLEVYFAEWEFSARHHLTASDAETVTIADLLELVSGQDRDAFQHLPLGYTPTWGTDQLREEIASTYSRLGSQHILVFSGAEEAIYWAMLESVGTGNHAIVTVPNYQSLESVTLASGADVSALSLRPEDEWSLDMDQLRRLLRPTTRLIAVNFPNNPTGAVPDAATFRALVELCDENDIRLFSDEVYRGLELDRDLTLPQAAELSDSAVSLNAMSKAYGLPGLRIGWLASYDRGFLERLEKRKHYTSICSSAPSEHLAAMALRSGEHILERNQSIIRQNLPRFEAFFNEWSDLFEWEPPQGGCVSFPRYFGAEGAENFCRTLAQEAGVLLLPPHIFQSALADVPTDRFRIGIGRNNPAPALEAVDSHLRSRSSWI